MKKNVENTRNGTARPTTVSWGQATDGTTNLRSKGEELLL